MEEKVFLRNVIGEYMTALGDKDSRVVVVNADLSGTCRNRSFVDKYENRSFNVGIAEQNMVSFAAGIASEGYVTYVFTMAPFLTMRACEQCRTDVAYGKRNVKMIGVYAGVSGGISGATHWAIEDIGIMASIPDVVILEVSDEIQAKRIMDLSLEYDGPMYIRSTVEPTINLYDSNFKAEIGKSYIVRDGNDGAILCSGVTVQYAYNAANEIEKETGKRIRVVDMYSIKPIDIDAVIQAANTGRVLVAQDHNVIGGLGSIVAQTIAENSLSTIFKVLGIRDEFVAMAHANYLYSQYELDTKGIKNNMLKMFEE